MPRSALVFGMLLAAAWGCGESGNPAGNSGGPPDPVLASGTVTLPTFQGIDMETGAFSTLASTADLYTRSAGTPLHLELLAPGARSDYVYFGLTAPRRSDCHGGLAQDYYLDTLPGDVYSCIVTPEGHYGYFHFPVWPPWGQDSVRISYVLWANP